MIEKLVKSSRRILLTSLLLIEHIQSKLFSIRLKRFFMNSSNFNTKMSFPIEALPDELLLHLFKFLKFKDLGRCLQVSKTFRKMALDETLWEKIKTVDQDVSAEFLIQALTHGAKHLSLESSLSLYRFEYRQIYTFSDGGLEFQVQNRLKTLNLEIGADPMLVSALLESSQGLEKLYLRQWNCLTITTDLYSPLEELKPALSCSGSVKVNWVF